MGKKNITFNDIAKYTGFSKTTVSRYFNNPDSLTLKNQQIISDALDKLNYQENKVARILKRENRIYRCYHSKPLFTLLF